MVMRLNRSRAHQQLPARSPDGAKQAEQVQALARPFSLPFIDLSLPFIGLSSPFVQCLPPTLVRPQGMRTPKPSGAEARAAEGGSSDSSSRAAPRSWSQAEDAKLIRQERDTLAIKRVDDPPPFLVCDPLPFLLHRLFLVRFHCLSALPFLEHCLFLVCFTAF